MSNAIFLGFCQRAHFNERVLSWNALGFSQALFTPVLPMLMKTFYFVFVVDPEVLFGGQLRFKLIDPAGHEAGNIQIDGRLQSLEPGTVAGGAPAGPQAQGPTIHLAGTKATLFSRITGDGFALRYAGIYTVVQELPDGDSEIGKFDIVKVEALPLTPERIAAIRSDPKASKAVHFMLGCKNCPTQAKYYFGLDRVPKLEEQGWRWSPDAPDEFRCECGSTVFETSSLRTGLAAFLGRPAFGVREVDALPLYEQSALQSVRDRFLALLNENPGEEVVQQFIQNNTILLHFFTGQVILNKPRIGKNFADFAIHDAHGDLVLIELEKPGMKLLTKKHGHRSSDLTHAFDQIGDWRRELEEHRIARLVDMGLRYEDVHRIRGVVIAGRDAGHDAGHLRNLRKRDNDGNVFLTYDDLLGHLDVLIRGMQRVEPL